MTPITPITPINSNMLLDILISHETLTIDAFSTIDTMKTYADKTPIKPLLEELHAGGFIETLNDVSPLTYTITEKGIAEGTRLK